MTTHNTPDKQGEALKPCPLSHLVEFGVSFSGGKSWWVVCCFDCGLQTRSETTQTEARKIWNSRASVAAVEGDELRLALKDLFDLVERSPIGEWCFKSLSRDAGKFQNVMESLFLLTAASSSAPAEPPKFVSEVDQWKHDLTTAGWIAETALNWRAPDGSLWRGPAGAWKELQRRNAESLQPTGEQGMTFSELCHVEYTPPPNPSDAAMRAAREWMNTHHASLETNQRREEALAAIITRYLPSKRSSTTPNYALVRLLNAAMMHPEQAEGYIRQVIAELDDDSPKTPERQREIFDAGFPATADNEGEGK